MYFFQNAFYPLLLYLQQSEVLKAYAIAQVQHINKLRPREINDLFRIVNLIAISIRILAFLAWSHNSFFNNRQMLCLSSTITALRMPLSPKRKV